MSKRRTQKRAIGTIGQGHAPTPPPPPNSSPGPPKARPHAMGGATEWGTSRFAKAICSSFYTPVSRVTAAEILPSLAGCLQFGSLRFGCSHHWLPVAELNARGSVGSGRFGSGRVGSGRFASLRFGSLKPPSNRAKRRSRGTGRLGSVRFGTDSDSAIRFDSAPFDSLRFSSIRFDSF